MKRRQLAMAFGLGGVCWLWLQAPAEPTATTAAVPGRLRTTGAPQPEVLGLRQRTGRAYDTWGGTRDLFAAQALPAPAGMAPPGAEPVVAPPPAPALPFAYLGKKIEAGEWEVFLAQGEQTFVVRAGSLIDSRYRIDAIAPSELRLTYLPLGETQVMAIGSTP